MHPSTQKPLHRNGHEKDMVWVIRATWSLPLILAKDRLQKAFWEITKMPVIKLVSLVWGIRMALTRRNSTQCRLEFLRKNWEYFQHRHWSSLRLLQHKLQHKTLYKTPTEAISLTHWNHYRRYICPMPFFLKRKRIWLNWAVDLKWKKKKERV